MKIILFTRKDKPMIKEIIGYLRKYSKGLVIYKGTFAETFPKVAKAHSADIIISYLCPWKIPANLLSKTRLYNINFHPGPPEYPGIGCTNFAIYNNERIYGVTAHLMNEKIDNGKVIAVKRFPLLKSDSVYSLTEKSYKHMLDLFYEVMDFIFKNNRLPHSSEGWKRPAYRREELERLCKINLDAAESDISKRVRATTYPDMPGPYIEVSGYRFEYNPHARGLKRK